jgi:hypothetical protein
MAGDVALSLDARSEAEAHFVRALAVAGRLPEPGDALSRLEAKRPAAAMS